MRGCGISIKIKNETDKVVGYAFDNKSKACLSTEGTG